MGEIRDPEAAGGPAEGAGLVVRRMEDADRARWDRFVEACPDATFFHRSGWSAVLREGLGHRDHYLLAERDGRIEGVLPLGHIRSRLFGNALISVPFCVAGGAAAQGPEAGSALVEAASALAQRLGVDYLELRHGARRCPGWPARSDLYVGFKGAIDPDPGANMRAIPRKQRAMVRKGIQAGLVSTIDDDIGRMYDVYSESVRNLGTPVLPRRYYAMLKEVFGSDCEVLTVTKDGVPVASVMSFFFRDQVLPYYGGGTARARDLKANDFMYWEVMRRACSAGYRVFDYGRSKVGTGSYAFKKNWGFRPQPLHYEYLLVRANEVPNLNPLNPKYRLFIDLWKRLPLAASRRLGPMVARSLG